MSDEDKKVVELALVRPEETPDEEPNAWLDDWFETLKEQLTDVEIDQMCLTMITADGVALHFPVFIPGTSPYALMGALGTAADVVYEAAAEVAPE
ncbi:MAG: hypothetical protein ACPGVG_00540 [Mycobacterium sp.]